MATPEEIAALRLMVAEPNDVAPYTDAVLGAMLDAVSGESIGVAATVWEQKAAAAANLVDMSEGGSSRKMGDLYEQALSMAAHFAARVPPDGSAVKGARLHKLVRP